MTRRRAPETTAHGPDDERIDLDFIWTVWVHLSPAERQRRSWAMRRLIPDLEAYHDAKSWPRL